MILSRIKRYAAIATGDYEKIFAGMKLPVLPQAAMKLLDEIKKSDTSMKTIAEIISSDPGLSAHVLKMVNSALYALPNKISSIIQGANILGIKKIENLAISYAVMSSLSDPKKEGFNFDLFWSESMYKALFARKCAKIFNISTEDAFAAGLLQDIALPVLLTAWFDVYKKVYKVWINSNDRLSIIERKILSWTHAQAGAWIAKRWELPDILVCSIGLHVANMSQLKKLQLIPSVPAVVALSSLIPSKEMDKQALFILYKQALILGLNMSQLLEIFEEVDSVFQEITACFDIKAKKKQEISKELKEILS